MKTTYSASPVGKFSGSEPQISTTMPRRITASPTVAITMENTGSPSIGRMISRSSASPIAIEMGIVTIQQRNERKPERIGEAEGDVRRQHDQFALREIDHAGRFVDQREAHGDQPVGRARDQSGSDQERQYIHQAALP